MQINTKQIDSSISILNKRKDFPLLCRYPELSYLDSSSTTQKPQCVIDALVEYYETSNANAHRGVYKISALSSEKFEQTRIKIANYLGARSEEEIIYTRGTTEGINIVAQSFLKAQLEPGDTILLGGAEHHANIVPWQVVAKDRGAKIEYIKILDSGELDLEHAEKLILQKPKILALSHISNIIGTINPIEKIISLANESHIPILIDGAQSISHININVSKLNCDFFTFSGHKAYGPMGIGVLFVKQNILKTMTPFLTGGGMIEDVNLQDSTYLNPPYRFEAGTQNIADAYAMGVALDYISSIGLDKIHTHELNLTNYALEKLNLIPNLSIIGPKTNRKAPIITFTLKNIHAHDIASLLDEKNVAIRAGHHCSQHTMKRFDLTSTVRVSFGIYNTYNDVDKLIDAINYAKSIFKVE